MASRMFIHDMILYHRWSTVIERILKRRAEKKWNLLAPHIPSGSRSLLDLGAGEGYVGEYARIDRGIEVYLADVTDFNRTPLPYITFDGRRLPVEDRRFDTTILVYVLHHAENPGQVLTEARRVTRNRIVILESVYETTLDRWVLGILDRAVNSLRFIRNPSGVMHVQLRTADEWTDLLEDYGSISYSEQMGRFPHRKALFIVDL
jgi:ubiquinone/menaquinone biosynthesis C-methylase UbiE